MKRIIAITGTPGTGKSTVAKALGKELGATVISINDFITENHLVLGTDADGTRIADLGRLESKLSDSISVISTGKGFLIIEGHLLSDIRVKGAVAIVIREHLGILLKRLKKRGYHFDKIRDNVVSEAIGLCGSNARKRYGSTYEIMGGRMAKSKAVMIARNGKVKNEEIDMMPEFLRLIKKDKRFLT